jgi:hypothetical protein
MLRRLLHMGWKSCVLNVKLWIRGWRPWIKRQRWHLHEHPSLGSYFQYAWDSSKDVCLNLHKKRKNKGPQISARHYRLAEQAGDNICPGLHGQKGHRTSERTLRWEALGDIKMNKKVGERCKREKKQNAVCMIKRQNLRLDISEE